MIIALALELRMSCKPLEEVLESAIQVPERLLERDGIDILQISEVILLFKVCKHAGSLIIADLLSGRKSVITHGKTFVVDESAAPECLNYQALLLFVGICPESYALLHAVTYGLVF